MPLKVYVYSCVAVLVGVSPSYDGVVPGDTDSVLSVLPSPSIQVMVCFASDKLKEVAAYITPNSYPVGCVATAMAQIMFHYKWPNQGMGSMRYEWNGKFVEENFAEHTYDWSVMKNTANANRMGKAKEAVARISYDCGVATQMQYGEGGSGTQDDLAYVAYYKFFDYDASSLDFKRQMSCASQEEW